MSTVSVFFRLAPLTIPPASSASMMLRTAKETKFVYAEGSWTFCGRGRGGRHEWGDRRRLDHEHRHRWAMWANRCGGAFRRAISDYGVYGVSRSPGRLWPLQVPKTVTAKHMGPTAGLRCAQGGVGGWVVGAPSSGVARCYHTFIRSFIPLLPPPLPLAARHLAASAIEPTPLRVTLCTQETFTGLERICARAGPQRQ